MSPELQRASLETQEHSARGFSRPKAATPDPLRRLKRVAHREPTALLGVLEYWLGPQMAEGETRGDC